MPTSSKKKSPPVPKSKSRSTATVKAKKKAVVGRSVPAKSGTKIVFSISAPEVQSAFVAGDFNGWKPLELKTRGKGIYTAVIKLPPGRYEYKFLLDGQWQLDPACMECVPNAFGSFNSMMAVN